MLSTAVQLFPWLSGTSLMLSVPSYHLQKLLRNDSKHLRLNMNKYNLEDMIAECEEYIQRLRSLAIEVSGSDVASVTSVLVTWADVYQVCCKGLN